MGTLNRAERLRLMKFVCAFAWADLQVHEAERGFVAQMGRRLGLEPEEQLQVKEWLETPPRPEEVDPTAIPQEHRRVFLQTVEQILIADEEIAPEERESLRIFKQLLSSEPS